MEVIGCKPFVCDISNILNNHNPFAQENVNSFSVLSRPLISTAEVTLSPRHEQAKRLLERARFKARSQNPKSETPNCLGQREAL